jgi:shikimate kinase
VSGLRRSATAKAGREPGTSAVILIGFMGAGKSTVGRTLAAKLGWTFEDLDERIELRARRKVSDIFRDGGESGFRRAEHLALKELLSELQGGSERIVALGGGAFAQRDNARLIEASKAPTVFLDADAAELWRRCQQQAVEQRTGRPLLGNLQSFRELYQSRRSHYLRASLRQETAGKTVEAIAEDLVQALHLERSRKRRGGK